MTNLRSEYETEQRRSKWLRGARCGFLLVVMALAATVTIPRPASAAAVQAPTPAAAPLGLEYHLRIVRPTTHLAEVEIDVAAVTEPTLDFVMPAWSPGRYAIYNFAKNVQEFSAEDLQGHALRWTQPDKETWRVEARDAAGNPIGTLRVRYQVYANDLNGSFSQIDSSHANLDGASIYMYVDGHKPEPIALTVEAPSGWKLASGFSLSTEERHFKAPNYDRLIDTPMEISDALSLDQFQVDGKTFRVVVHSYPGDEDDRGRLLNELTSGVKKIVSSEMAMMPALDFDDYTFLFHFAPDIAAGDGMEHLNSTQIIISRPLSDNGVAEALENAAHEFFHVWNVKRLRPAALGPFDYTREDYTRSLWFAEGVTSYYAYVNLRRSGIWTPKEFLDHMAGEIRTLRGDPGRALASAESSSFHAWFYDRAPQMQETNFANSTISYYNKGALLGMLLDLEIRSRTHGRKSLDDVMRLMYDRFYGAPPSDAPAASATYYLPGRGYEEKDILDALNEVSGSDFTSFFERYVQGVDPLPYDAVLALAGLKLNVSATPGAPPSLGVLTQPADTGVRIVAVRPGGAADRAGLSRDDLLISVDEQSLATESLDDRLKIYPPGAEVPFEVQRHLTRQRIEVKLDPPVPDQYFLRLVPEATSEQVAIRDGWLGRAVTSDE
ncbi:MAG TPA: PDZ domain-containing protein [Terriglobia bacterium]|nr:PDZ domain-containing protein [Terriglobia bacterium]